MSETHNPPRLKTFEAVCEAIVNLGLEWQLCGPNAHLRLAEHCQHFEGLPEWSAAHCPLNAIAFSWDNSHTFGWERVCAPRELTLLVTGLADGDLALRASHPDEWAMLKAACGVEE